MPSCRDGLSLYRSFFFQAEDGIRDSSVTGVQTCALPISQLGAQWALLRRHRQDQQAFIAPALAISRWVGQAVRSAQEEAPRGAAGPRRRGDRESVVWGKRVDLGGRRII